MKTTLTILIIAITYNAQAGTFCYSALLGNKWQDSYNHKVFVDNNSILNKQLANKTVLDLLKKLKCQTSLKLDNTKCTNLLDTSICRIDIELGYFILFPDYVDSYNVVFNRWD